MRRRCVLFVRSGGTWSEQQELTASDGAGGDDFGEAVGIAGSTLVVGAPYRDDYRGAAYLFGFSGGSWVQQKELTAADSSYDEFGDSVAASGSRVAVGAPTSSAGGASEAGAAYVFGYAGGSWRCSSELTASDPAQQAYFGWSVSLFGSELAVGALGNNSYTGAAYVFTSSGGTWSQQAELTGSDSAQEDQFGTSVAIYRNALVVGAPYHNPYAGAAYMFSGSGSTWAQTAEVTSSDNGETTSSASRWACGAPRR